MRSRSDAPARPAPPPARPSCLPFGEFRGFSFSSSNLCGGHDSGAAAGGRLHGAGQPLLKSAKRAWPGAGRAEGQGHGHSHVGESTRERRLPGRDVHSLSCTAVTFISAFSLSHSLVPCFFGRLCPPSGTFVSLSPSHSSSLAPTGSGLPLLSSRSPFSPFSFQRLLLEGGEGASLSPICSFMGGNRWPLDVGRGL